MPVKGKGGNFRDQIVEEAEKQGVELDPATDFNEPVTRQEQLPEVPPNEKPVTVRGIMMLAEFVKPHFSMDEGDRRCALEFSFPLTKEHEGLLPKSVEDAWKFLDKRTSKGVTDIDISDQVLDIRLVPDDEVELHIGSALIRKATVSMTKETGKGASEKVARFSFHAVTDATKTIYTFAATQFGNPVWIEMGQSQGELDV